MTSVFLLLDSNVGVIGIYTTLEGATAAISPIVAARPKFVKIHDLSLGLVVYGEAIGPFAVGDYIAIEKHTLQCLRGVRECDSCCRVST